MSVLRNITGPLSIVLTRDRLNHSLKIQPNPKSILSLGVRCKPRAKGIDIDTSARSPGPVKYDDTVGLKALSTFSGSARHSIPGTGGGWKEQQIVRLNRHRAKQTDWPSCGDLSTRSDHVRDGTHKCNFGKTTQNRPFFPPLQNSAAFSVSEKLTRRLAAA